MLPRIYITSAYRGSADRSADSRLPQVHPCWIPSPPRLLLPRINNSKLDINCTTAQGSDKMSTTRLTLDLSLQNKWMAEVRRSGNQHLR